MPWPGFYLNMTVFYLSALRPSRRSLTSRGDIYDRRVLSLFADKFLKNETKAININF